jgi:hypothetical protein
MHPEKDAVRFGSRSIVALTFALLVSLLPVATAGAATTDIGFTTQPGNASGPGALLTPQPVVRATMFFGQPVATSITLSIASGTGTPGAALSCSSGTTLPTDARGNAAFSGCSINLVGSGYRLLASAAVGGTALSTPFSVGVSPANHLVFVQQPGGGAAGATWSQQPRVAVENASNAVVTSDFSTIVTLAIGTNPAGGSLTCTNATLTVSGGYASFAGCSINLASVNPYTLTATSNNGTATATSNPFYIGANVAPRTVVAIALDSAAGNSTSGFSTTTKVVSPGTPVTFRIQTSPQLAFATVGIWIARKTGGTWSAFSPHTSVTLDANGSALYVYTAGSVVWQSFVVRFAGDATHFPGSSHGRQARWR